MSGRGRRKKSTCITRNLDNLCVVCLEAQAKPEGRQRKKCLVGDATVPAHLSITEDVSIGITLNEHHLYRLSFAAIRLLS